MKDKAIEYLMKNPLLHMGMMESINRNTAYILYADSDCVLIKEQRSNAYMISADNFNRGRDILNTISECNLIVAHQNDLADYIENKFGLKDKLACFQAVYMDKIKLDVKSEIRIRKLELDHMDIILEHYKKLSQNEIIELLNSGDIFGGYKNDTLIGFIGNHLEGSIGLLEIFPKYRRRGYASILESFMVNRMLEKEFVPFAQVEINHKNSIALHNKLGFQISEDRLYWLY